MVMSILFNLTANCFTPQNILKYKRYCAILNMKGKY